MRKPVKVSFHYVFRKFPCSQWFSLDIKAKLERKDGAVFYDNSLTDVPESSERHSTRQRGRLNCHAPNNISIAIKVEDSDMELFNDTPNRPRGQESAELAFSLSNSTSQALDSCTTPQLARSVQMRHYYSIYSAPNSTLSCYSSRRHIAKSWENAVLLPPTKYSKAMFSPLLKQSMRGVQKPFLKKSLQQPRVWKQSRIHFPVEPGVPRKPTPTSVNNNSFPSPHLYSSSPTNKKTKETKETNYIWKSYNPTASKN
jgi:hypothetical protein